MLVVAMASHQRVRRSHLKGEGEVRTASREDRLVCGISLKTYGVAEVVALSRVEQEVVIPIIEFVCLPAKGMEKNKVVIRPVEPASKACAHAVNLHILV